MAVSKRTRYEVLRRDNHTCRYCGGSAPDVALTVDHVTPVALGGTDDPANLVAACKDCNAGKTSTSPDAATVEQVAQDAVRWAAAMKRAAAIRAQQRAIREDYVDQFDSAWDGWHYGSGRHEIPRPGNWRQSVWGFHEAGLPINDLCEAVDIACANGRVAPSQTWRYMCGVAWRKVAELQDMAKALTAADESPY